MKKQKDLKLNALRHLSCSDLQTEQCKLLREQLDLKMQHKTRRLGETHKLRGTRRSIARIYTLLTEKAVEQAPEIQ
jgi:large subunit ribosomal protein L29